MEVIFKFFSGQTIDKAGMGKLPFCALYGTGTILLYIISSYFENVVLVFLVSMLSLTFIEFVAGFLLDKFFGMELWDYQDKKLSINKYICGEFMITWGATGVLFSKILLPLFRGFFLKIDTSFTFYMLIILTIIIAINYLVAAVSNIKLRNFSV